MSAAALDKLQDSEVLALAAWIEATGRAWKSELWVAWAKAGEKVPNYTPELQAIRNRHGVSVVNNITTGELLDEAKKVTDARAPKSRVKLVHIETPEAFNVERYSIDGELFITLAEAQARQRQIDGVAS